MIDLAIYPRPVLAALHGSGMSCVYVLAYESGKPCRIGYAKRPVAKITELRRANAHVLDLHHLVWTPSLGVAMVIDQAAREQLQNDGTQRDWHDCPVGEAIGAVDLIVDRLYRNADQVMPHNEMLKRLRGNKLNSA